MRKVRPFAYCPWASRLTAAEPWLSQVPSMDLRSRVSNPADPKLMSMGRLDCDWHAESVRCFSHLQHENLQFLPAMVLGREGAAELLGASIPPDEEWWYITYGQHPQGFDKLAAPFFAALRKKGIRVFYYAFDEASRFMPCFRDIAPNLSILVHDEAPLDPAGASALPASCTEVHLSWVANLLPFAAPLSPEPEKKIIFLGSEMGLTPHRRRQVDFLAKRFKDRFVPFHDHSVAVTDRLSLNRFKVSLCPEGRKFSTPSMARTHTDRPFWSGCLGLVPVSEDSVQGGRLDALADEGLLLRYPHGDLETMASLCEQALEAPLELRQRIHAHYNARETVGSVIARLIAAYTS